MIYFTGVISILSFSIFMNHLQKHSSPNLFGKLINSHFDTEARCNSNLVIIYVSDKSISKISNKMMVYDTLNEIFKL